MEWSSKMELPKSWFEKLKPSRIRTARSSKRQIPEGVWNKCENCNAMLYRPELERNLHVCPKCDHHMRIGARQRLGYFLDEEGRVEIGENVGNRRSYCHRGL